jgi:hypothetical protein
VLIYLPNFQNNSVGFLNRYQFWVFIIVAIIFMQLPIVSVPFKWLESYFHEISHGLTALITGGSVVKIELFPNGAGLCTTRGGFTLLISFMGYAGAILWGYLIYSIASINQKIAKVASGLIILLIISSLVFWVRDILTLFILIIVLSIFLLQFKLPKLSYLQKLLKFTGIMVLLNSLLSPLYLLDGRSIGDGARLAEITLIPELIWVIIWSTIAILVLFTLSKQSKVASR